MYLLHIALPGCLRAHNVQYGLTRDTGGHIRYLLELSDALAATPAVTQLEIATRAFRGFDPCYALPYERRGKRICILRVPTECSGYLAKEDLPSQIDSFAEGLIAVLRKRSILPRAMHAHFADAAMVAERVERALGIPFIFTPHSLGAVKAAAMQGLPDPGLAERIRLEDRALGRASAVIVSSPDERDRQLALYPSYQEAMRTGRIRVLPPGCALERFRTPPSCNLREQVARKIDRFLEYPARPLLLGLARPVAKKNLAGLVEAFAAVPELRETANLAIFAGMRTAIAEAEDENAAVLRDLLERIDRHDLWGQVALPKTHTQQEVPAIYHLAAQRGGLFVNLAFNEPFGLTLLEAAASGLPVVATDSGGPRDILARCGNGTLVSPSDPGAGGQSMLSLLKDRALWLDCATQGVKRVGAYDWAAHVHDYLALIEEVAPQTVLARPTVLRAARGGAPEALVITDIDNTLTGDVAGLCAFSDWRRENPRVAFAVATGRHLEGARAVLRDWGAPEPDLFVTSVGSEVDRPTGHGFIADAVWRRLISTGWRRRRIAEVVARFPAIVPQPDENQGPFKLSYFAPAEDDLISRLRAALWAAECPATVIHSHGCYLDVLPVRASKGSAARYAAKWLGVPADRIIAAGDSGNDVALLEAASFPVLVANHLAEVGRFSPAVEKRLWRSREPAAAGLLDGAERALRCLNSPDAA